MQHAVCNYAIIAVGCQSPASVPSSLLDEQVLCTSQNVHTRSVGIASSIMKDVLIPALLSYCVHIF